MGLISNSCDDWIRRMHVPFDFADEVKDHSLLGYTEHLSVQVLGVRRFKHVVAFAISVIIGIVDDFNKAIVAHATRKDRLNDLRILALSDFACHPGDRRGVRHLNIVVEVILIKLSTTKIVFNVTRTPPCIALSCLEADVWRICERWIKAVQMPMRGAEVTFQQRTLVATRKTTLRTQDRLLVSVKHFRVVRLLVAIAAVLRTVLC
jgi:hypothetical protein